MRINATHALALTAGVLLIGLATVTDMWIASGK